MSRSPSLATFVVAASILGSLLASGCRSRTPAGRAVAPPVASLASPLRDATVRSISRPSGAALVLAEIDHRRIAIVADEEESALQLVDLETRSIASTYKLEGAPGQLLLAPDGTLLVAVRGAAQVVSLRFQEGGGPHAVARHATAEEPFGLALTPDGSTVLVSTITDPGLEALRAADLAPVFRMPLDRDPRSIAVSSDGGRAFVTHATGSRVSVVDVTGPSPGKTRTVSLDARERRRDFGQVLVTKPMMAKSPRMASIGRRFEPPGRVQSTMKRSATQGFALAMIGERLFVPETLVMTSDSERIPTGYGSVEQSTLSTHVPFMARIGGTNEALENPEFSGPADRGCFEQKPECILPRAVADDGQKLYVACLDSDEVLVVDPDRDAEHAPACLQTSKERARLKVESPSGLAVDAARGEVAAFSTFSRTLTVLALGGGERVEVALPRSAPLTEAVAEGRRLFHRSADPRIAKNGRACASCHVDGRDDGLVWPTPMGKRQTPMLAGRLEGTAPYGWNGEHASLALHIEATVKNLEGTGITASQLDALAQYVASMHAPSRPAAGSTAVARGKSLFHSSETGCASCHVEDTRFTDRDTHMLGASTPRPFDTPSLAFVGQTAPYFHDGRFATLEDLIDGCEDPKTMMGRTKQLEPDDRRALVAYLRSL